MKHKILFLMVVGCFMNVVQASEGEQSSLEKIQETLKYMAKSQRISYLQEKMVRMKHDLNLLKRRMQQSGATSELYGETVKSVREAYEEAQNLKSGIVSGSNQSEVLVVIKMIVHAQELYALLLKDINAIE